jgi:acetylornithine deacetylase/succinyl-diaminopimelate desuccinylase-like protein
MMAAVLDSIAGMSLPSDPELGDAIIVATDIVSDPYPSVSLIPSTVTVRFDRRTLLGEREDDVLARLRATLGRDHGDAITVRVTEDDLRAYTGEPVPARRFLPAWRLAQDDPLRAALLESMRAARVEPTVGVWGFCTNGSESAGVRGLPTIGLGPGRAEEAHIVDESVSVDEVRRATEIYERLAITYGRERT